MTPVRAARVDANQAQIVAELRQCGVTVQHLHMVGQGCPDIMCGWAGETYVFEIKDPDKPPSRRRLTEDEERWHQEWVGQVNIILTAEDALMVMGVMFSNRRVK